VFYPQEMWQHAKEAADVVIDSARAALDRARDWLGL
jgi:hypothetical protein